VGAVLGLLGAGIPVFMSLQKNAVKWANKEQVIPNTLLLTHYTFPLLFEGKYLPAGCSKAFTIRKHGELFLLLRCF
jgi:hypothetical protein